MADVNNVTIIGRLTRDAELKYTAGGFAIASLAIAVNRRKKDGDQWVEEVSFFDVTLYGKSAESLKQYLVKGKQIAVVGELRQDRWEKDGQKFSKVIIAANNVQLLGGNSGGNNSGSYSNSSAAGGYNQNTNSSNSSYQPRNDAPPSDAMYGDDSGFLENVPF